jgi:hypothetical protein
MIPQRSPGSKKPTRQNSEAHPQNFVFPVLLQSYRSTGTGINLIDSAGTLCGYTKFKWLGGVEIA